MSAAAWCVQYEEVKAAIAQRRREAGGGEDGLAQLSIRVQQLGSKLKALGAAPVEHNLVASELSRRTLLVDNLKQQVERLQVGLLTGKGSVANASVVQSSTSSSSFDTASARSSASLGSTRLELIQQQDDLITDIGAGVDRLRASALLMNDEASLHARLLDDFDSDVSMATAALQAEATRASAIKDRTEMGRLYLCIAIEAFILLIMLFAWSTRG